MQKRHVLVCEDSLSLRKLLDVSGPGLGEAGCYTTWLEDLEERFAGVATTIDHEDFNEHPQSKGPSKSWLLQFQVQFRTKRCVDVFYGFEISHVFLMFICSYFIAAGSVGSRC